jgi:hypothetical protein
VVAQLVQGRVLKFGVLAACLLVLGCGTTDSDPRGSGAAPGPAEAHRSASEERLRQADERAKRKEEQEERAKEREEQQEVIRERE